VVPLTLEVTKPAELTAAAEAANDVTLVNNAGVATGLGAALTDPAIIVNGKTERDVNVLGTPQATRAHLAAQGTAVHGVYSGPIDTDMAKDLPMDKTSAADTTNSILDGVQAGAEEIYPDPFSQDVGKAYATIPKAVERQFGGLAAA
jgi:NAD(P)-dependent dehydrogenase (short-subunit alcohol dehydrogenase family)